MRAIDVSVPQSLWQASSEILPELWKSVACSLAFVMVWAIDWLVADVTEYLLTWLTCEHVISSFLPIDLATIGTFNHCPDIYVGILIQTHVLFNHLLSNLKWLQMWCFIDTLRPFFVMLLSFCRVKTCPTKVLPTLSTLDMSTTTLDFRNSYTTLWVWAPFGALLEVNLVKSVFYFLISFLDVVDFRFVFDKQIDSVNHTSLEWMNLFFAVKAKVKFTVLAFTWIILLVFYCNRPTGWQWTPAHVIHLLNCIFEH